MKIQPYFEKLSESQEFKKFKQKYNDSFLVAGFFVLDFEMGQNIHQIDYYIPSQKKFAAFGLDEGVTMQILDSMTDNTPEQLDMNTNIDLDAIRGILEDEMRNRSITEEIKKIVAVIQNIKGKKIWNINSVLSGMDILKAHIEDSSKTILKMEKTSIMEIMKKIPVEQIKTQMQREQSSEDIAEEIKKLDKLEEKIEKEKEKLKKEITEKIKTPKNKIAKKAKPSS